MRGLMILKPRGASAQAAAHSHLPRVWREQGWRGGKDHDGHTGMIYSREGMRHQCWSLVIVSTERGRHVGDVVLHHGLPRSRGSPVYRRGHGESVFACASTLVRRGEYRAQTGIWRLLGFVSARTIKGRSIDEPRPVWMSLIITH